MRKYQYPISSSCLTVFNHFFLYKMMSAPHSSSLENSRITPLSISLDDMLSIFWRLDIVEKEDCYSLVDDMYDTYKVKDKNAYRLQIGTCY